MVLPAPRQVAPVVGCDGGANEEEKGEDEKAEQGVGKGMEEGAVLALADGMEATT